MISIWTLALLLLFFVALIVYMSTALVEAHDKNKALRQIIVAQRRRLHKALEQ